MLRKDKWINSLKTIYGDEQIAREIADRMEGRFAKLQTPAKEEWLSEKDVMLITYGDSLYKKSEKGIVTLKNFLEKYVGDAISAVHILPMFPYTSDDGFSVVDYKKINKDIGDWDDVIALSRKYQLMYDAVVNHISKSSEWFQKYLACEEPYKNYFITCDPNADYSTVTRPRALPLLTAFETKEGTKYVWTTFSDDQMDLNFACPDVLIDVMDVLLTYANRGARFIRLDAIGFLWKTLGTTCMHLPQTHEIVKLARTLLEDYAPGTLIITETNVPHKDNISYFGDGTDEANLIYQFPLPPLTMYSLLAGDAGHLTDWAAKLEVPSDRTTYFNFLSSHDGIGVRPVEGILSESERDVLIKATLQNGGVVSYKDNGDGTQSPYELNINYQDALASPEESDEVRIGRFLAAETILLSLKGLPGIYIHSLLGSRNDYYGKTTSGIPRRINREKLEVEALEQKLEMDTNRKKIFEELLRRLQIRKKHSAFSPSAKQTVLKLDKRVFALLRESDEGDKILALINVSGEKVQLHFTEGSRYDLISEKQTAQDIQLGEYECKWIVL